MNFLGQLFNDDAYASFLEESPTPSVALVGGTASTRQVIADRARAASSSAPTKLRIQTFAAVGQIYPKRPPHSSYEGHKAGSVMKRNWCLKHMTRVFGCVGLLVDWDGVKINDRAAFEQHIAQLFEGLRAHMRSSANTRVMLVLVTNLTTSDVPPCNLYATFEEAQAALRSKLGLDSKSLAVVYRDGVDEYSVGRLQRMLTDHCIKYHRDEIAKIKRMKGDAAKSTNPAYLQARLRFKAGWHCLVLQDLKLMKYNLEKGYDVLRQNTSSSGGTSAAATLDERVAATLLVWSMIASNCNQLAAASGSKQELVLEMLDVTVSTFLKHLCWVALPYTASFLATLDAEGLQILNTMHHIYLAEWYEMLAKKIRHVLDAHRIVPRRQQLSVSPGFHFQTAARKWEQVRVFAKSMRGGPGGAPTTPLSVPPPTFLGVECRTSAVYYKAIMGQITVLMASNRTCDLLQNSLRYLAAAGVPRSMVRVLYGIAEHLFVVDDYAGCYEKLQHILHAHVKTPGTLDNTMMCALHKLMVQSCRKIIKAASTVANNINAMEGGAADAEPTPAGGTVDSGAQFSTDPATFHDAVEYMVQVRSQLAASMLALIGNREVDPKAQEVIVNELGRMVADGDVPLPGAGNCYELPVVSGAGGGVLTATAFFSAPFAEAQTQLSDTRRHRTTGTSEASPPAHPHRAPDTLQVKLETSCSVPMDVASVSVTINQLTPMKVAVSNSSSLKLHGPEIEYMPTRAEGLERFVNACLWAQRDRFKVLARGKPVVLALKLVFPNDGLFEVSAIRVDWKLSSEATLPLQVQWAANSPSTRNNNNNNNNNNSNTQAVTTLYRRLESHLYDPAFERWDRDVLGYHDPPNRHRPVLRVVKPIATVSMRVVQSEQAIEGEVYPVDVVMMNHSDCLAATNMTLLVPWIAGTVDVVNVNPSEVEVGVPQTAPASEAHLVDASDDPSLALHSPDGYELSRTTRLAERVLAPGASVTLRLYFHCRKGGKFELPLRLRYRSRRADATRTATDRLRDGDAAGAGGTLLDVVRLLTLHVCHPVFVTYNVLGSQNGAVDAVQCGVPSDASNHQFIESSVLRDAATVLDDPLSQCATLGRMLRVDNDFAKRLDGSGGGGGSRHSGGGVVTLSNMLYTVERMQVPSDARKAYEHPAHACGVPVTVLCKLSNSLQCGLTIRRIDLQLAETVAHHGDPPCWNPSDAARAQVQVHEAAASANSSDALLPVTLAVDEDMTIAFAIQCNTPGLQVPLGCLLLHLERRFNNGTLGAVGEGSSDADGVEGSDGQPPSSFTFELPLPAIDFTASSVQCRVDYPSTVVVGEPFLCTTHIHNTSLVGQSVEVLVTPSAAPTAGPGKTTSTAADQQQQPLLIGGRGRWTTSLSPGESKRTSLRLLPTTPGFMVLPEIAVTCGVTRLLRPDEIRVVLAVPPTQPLANVC